MDVALDLVNLMKLETRKKPQLEPFIDSTAAMLRDWTNSGGAEVEFTGDFARGALTAIGWIFIRRQFYASADGCGFRAAVIEAATLICRLQGVDVDAAELERLWDESP